MRTLVSSLVAALAMGSAVMAAPANLVVNGDFEAGNSGFASAHEYRAPVPGALEFGVLPVGAYTVGPDPQGVHSLWVSFGDHGTGSGNAMIVNGAYTPNILLWQSGPIGLERGVYRFGAFAARVCCVPGIPPYPPARLFLELVPVGGGPTITFASWVSTDHPPGLWTKAAGQRFLPTSTLAFLRVSNASTAFLGNDFALDDISLIRVPEPATWATMLVGFGSLGGLLRRRRRSIPQSAR
jgi:hypothetical protein